MSFLGGLSKLQSCPCIVQGNVLVHFIGVSVHRRHYAVNPNLHITVEYSSRRCSANQSKLILLSAHRYMRNGWGTVRHYLRRPLFVR